MSIVLLADDDPFLIKIYSNKLSQDGHEVHTASNGQEALEKAKEHKPDLVVLDVMIPRLNGLDVMTEIKQSSGTKKTKVVFLSNLTQPEEKEEAINRGAEEYLIKASYTPSQIIEKLQQYLDKPTKPKVEKAEKKDSEESTSTQSEKEDTA